MGDEDVGRWPYRAGDERPRQPVPDDTDYTNECAREQQVTRGDFGTYEPTLAAASGQPPWPSRLGFDGAGHFGVAHGRLVAHGNPRRWS